MNNVQTLSGFTINFHVTVLEYKDTGGQNITQYIQGIMGQAVQLKRQEYINLHGIPAGFWSGDEWSVMTLVKFHDDGILGSGKENPVLGDGIPATNQGFHLGMKNKVSPHKDLHNLYNFLKVFKIAS